MAGNATIKKLKNGDVIFTEGDPSGSAFVVVAGAVELTKNSRHGPVQLAKLKKGELFGEMGVIDGSARSATARAVGPTTLKEVTPDALMHGIQNDPDLSSKVMTKLVERLRAADEMLVKAGVLPTAQTAPVRASDTPKKKTGLFSRLFSKQTGRQATFEIIVADFHDDPDHQVTTALFNTLKSQAERLGGGLVNVRRADAPFAINDVSDSASSWSQIKSAAQKWLHDLEGDLLVWGQARAGGQMAHMRFSAAHPLRHERAGTINGFDHLDLPANMDDILGGFFYGATLSALVAHTGEQRDGFEAIIGPALDAARPATKTRMRDLTPDEQARLDIAFANLLATKGLAAKAPERLREAEEHYLTTLRNLRRTKSALLSGILHRHLGFAQSNWFDMGGNNNLLEAAIESLREACRTFSKEAYPMDWADLQAVIGHLLFKKDHIDESGTALKESIAAYQSALQVFSASTTPYRWGDAKHHLARALQLLGSQSGDLELIARAAETCREALAVRNKAQTPMLWAATQNNLGSALFLLCQKTRKPETAEAAVKAFQGALDVYSARQAKKLAKVTEKNLARAKEITLDLGNLPDSASNEVNFELDEFDDTDEN